MKFNSIGLVIFFAVSAFAIAEDKMDILSNKSLAFIEIQSQCYMKGQLNDEKKWLISETSEEFYAQKFANENYHEACVGSFNMSKYEVTKELYQQYATESENITIGAKGCYVVGKNGWENNPNADWQNPTFKQENTHPVVCISYYEAEQFVVWLNNKLKPSAPYRLPTEAEWELAARGSERQRGFWHYWGNDIASSEACRYANVSDLSLNEYKKQDYSFNCDDGVIQTANVHSYEPNDYTLYNMLGNVQEFTCSGYNDNPLETENSCESQEKTDNITVKGAAWYYPPIYNRAAFRGALPRNLRFFGVGFRLAQDTE